MELEALRAVAAAEEGRLDDGVRARIEEVAQLAPVRGLAAAGGPGLGVVVIPWDVSSKGVRAALGPARDAAGHGGRERPPAQGELVVVVAPIEVDRRDDLA